jgi:SAM-dependent methyltransferase
MISLFDDQLHEIDRTILSAQPADIQRLFRNVPLDIFGYMLLDVPPQFPNIKAFFPSMASDEAQESWTGSHGSALLTQSSAFVKSLVSDYRAIIGKDLDRSTVLDFGCGWGRLIRLMYKYVSFENIYAVDPWDRSIELCKQHEVKANIALSDWVPKSLPFQRQLDLIYSFSVFTHLSEKTLLVALRTLRRYIAKTGLLVLTVRPKEYWTVDNQGALNSKMVRLHDEKGFAFNPHNRPPIDGDITYGDASISPTYFERNCSEWRLVKIDYNIVDSYQVILFFQPA